MNEVDELQVVDLRALVAALETAQHARREVLANHPLLAVLCVSAERLQASKFIVTTEYVVLLNRPNNHHHQHFSSNVSLNRAVSALARIDGYRRHPRRPRVVELRVWLSSGT